MWFMEHNSGYKAPLLELIIELHQRIMELHNSTRMMEFHYSFMKLHCDKA